MPDEPSAPDARPFSPAEAIEVAKGWHSEFSVQGDQIMLRGRVPVYLEREIQDPGNYAALHAHLTEVARQRAELATENARQDRENQWAANFQYGSPGGGNSFNRPVELAKIRKELERRTAPAKATKAAKK